MRTRILVFLSLFLLISGGLLTEDVEMRGDLDDFADEEAFSTDDPDVDLRSNRSEGLRNRHARTRVSVKLLGGLRARSEHFLSASGLKNPARFSQQELYRLQQVYRL